MESEIIEVQEDVLRGVPGVEKMVSTATQGAGSIALTFDVGIPVERALLEVMNRLNQVPRYPADADEPVLVAGSSADENAAAWFSLRPGEGNSNDIDTYLDFVEEVVQTRFERVNGVVPAGELIRIERTVGPDQIRRVDRRRAVTLVVTPPSDMSLEEALNTLRSDVAPALLAQLPADGELSFYGSADDLEIALGNMGRSYLLAIIILYLLVSALFRSFRDSLLVLLVLPLATVGGVVALRLTDLLVFQPMDLLTMIGFITLLGLVVNNAILLVYQTRSSERAGASRRDAVEKAVRIRLRPILMSTLTSLFGMLPLLVMPGAGTELYRGMAAVIVGGMSVSTAFTLILLPSLLRLGEERQGAVIGGTLAGSYAVRQGEGS